VCPNAKENGQIRPSNTTRTVWNALSHLGFQPVQKTPTIHASSGFIGGSPAKMKIASEAGDISLLLGFLIWQINQE
jgi:hypothetical protein